MPRSNPSFCCIRILYLEAKTNKHANIRSIKINLGKCIHKDIDSLNTMAKCHHQWEKKATCHGNGVLTWVPYTVHRGGGGFDNLVTPTVLMV